jgi:hypothetical protein
VLAWGSATWLITGDPLHQLSSVYGSASQVQALGATSATLSTALHRLLAIAPGLPAGLALLAAGLMARRDSRLVAAFAVLGPVAALALAADIGGLVLPSLMAYAAVVPLVLVLVAVAAPRRSPGLQRLLALLVMAAAIPTAAFALLDLAMAPQEAPVIRPAIVAAATDRPTPNLIAGARAVTAFLDARHLPAGSVLIDSSSGFPVILASDNPHQFVITNDRDFRLALTDPTGMGIAYLVVPAPGNPVSIASLDALVRSYPDLERSGGGVGTLV